MTKQSGISVPLFAIPTTRSWGIGEFPDIIDFAGWASGAGQSVVQILPVMELPGHERSPYSALSSFALDPTYISLPLVRDFQALGGERALSVAERAAIADLQRAPRVSYEGVRRLKHPWLEQAWNHFARVEVAAGRPRADAFADFCARESWWLDEYALYRAVLQDQDQRAWWDWPEPLRRRDHDALARARAELHGEIEFRKYIQWIAAEQWLEAHRSVAPVRVSSGRNRIRNASLPGSRIAYSV